MKAIALREGLFSVDHTKVFVPFDPSKDNIKDRPSGSALLGVTPFVVVTDDDIILLDSGLGHMGRSDWQLLENLAAHGIGAGDITKILLSHLHKDHLEGLGEKREDGSLATHFPNAKIYLQKKELEYAQSSEKPSFDHIILNGIARSPQTVLLDGDGQLNDIITYKVTGGHSPFHQVFWFKDGTDTIFYGGDEAPQLFQLRNHINAKYDFDGKKAMEWRKLWYREGLKEHWTFLFYHDVKNPIVVLEK